MSRSEIAYLVRSDLYRYAGSATARDFFRHYFAEPGFRFSVWFRLYQWARTKRYLRYGARQLISLILRRQTYRFGISISPDARIVSVRRMAQPPDLVGSGQDRLDHDLDRDGSGRI